MSLTSGARSGKNNIRRTARPPPGKHFADADIPASDAGKGGGLSRSHFKEALSALFRGACFQTGKRAGSATGKRLSAVLFRADGSRFLLVKTTSRAFSPNESRTNRRPCTTLPLWRHKAVKRFSIVGCRDQDRWGARHLIATGAEKTSALCYCCRRLKVGGQKR